MLRHVLHVLQRRRLVTAHLSYVVAQQSSHHLSPVARLRVKHELSVRPVSGGLIEVMRVQRLVVALYHVSSVVEGVHKRGGERTRAAPTVDDGEPRLRSTGISIIVTLFDDDDDDDARVDGESAGEIGG